MLNFQFNLTTVRYFPNINQKRSYDKQRKQRFYHKAGELRFQDLLVKYITELFPRTLPYKPLVLRKKTDLLRCRQSSKQFSNALRSYTKTENAVAESLWTLHQTAIFPPREITIGKVQAVIKSLNTKKIPGMNRSGLCPTVLHKLVALYNLVLRHRRVLKCWKQAIIVAIPKGNKSPSRVENHRPISLLKTGLQKSLRPLSRNWYKTLSKSTTSSLPANSAFDTEAQAARPRTQVIAVVIDVEKEYDKVCH